mgnify:CR=1 FL=1
MGKKEIVNKGMFRRLFLEGDYLSNKYGTYSRTT